MSGQSQPPTNQLSKGSSLIQRLDRRWTQPVGLVDGQRFQTASTRVPNAILQRSTFIDQLQTRYGVHEDMGTGTDLTFAPPLNTMETRQTTPSLGFLFLHLWYQQLDQ